MEQVGELPTTILKQRHQVLFLLSLLSAITYLDRVCISVAGPRIQHALRLSPVQWGWVGGIFSISYALFEIPSQRISGRQDRCEGSSEPHRPVVVRFHGPHRDYLLVLLTSDYFGIRFAQAACWAVCMDVGVRSATEAEKPRPRTSADDLVLSVVST